MRQVGVTGTNLLNLYFSMLNLALTNGCGKITPTVKGDVSLSTAPSADSMCVEPIRSINVAAAISKDIYFVPEFDFVGITINSSAIDVTDVVADGISLYKLAAAGTISKVSM